MLAEMALALPHSLSPSRVTAFTACPLAFRLRAIDHLPEAPSPHAVKGTLVHRALEHLYWDHLPGDRTPEVASAEVDRAWTELQGDPDLIALGLEGEEAAGFRADAAGLVANLFALEDPDRVRAVGVEVRLETDLDGLALRGVLDRLDLTDDGDLVVIDYKTGRAPAVQHEQARLTGVHLYALLCERVLGRMPVAVRLLYLREPVTITAVPSAQTIRGQHQRTLAVWRAIERACDRVDFQPRRSPLCSYCSFQAWCPEFGGAPPPVPSLAAVPPPATAVAGTAPVALT